MKTLQSLTRSLLTSFLLAASADAQNWQTIDDFQHTTGFGSYATSLAWDDAGNAAVAGFAWVSSSAYVPLVNVTSDGGNTWQTVQPISGNARLNAITAVGAGNFIAVGEAKGGDGLQSMITLLSTDAGESWTIVDSFRHVPTANTVAQDLAVSANGEILVAGYSQLAAGAGSVWIVRRSLDGGVSWSTSDAFQMAPGADANAYAIVTVPGRGVFVGGTADTGGTSYPQATIRQRLASGAWVTVDRFTLDTTRAAYVYGLAADSAGNVYAVGESRKKSGNTEEAFWTTRKLPAAVSTWILMDKYQLQARTQGNSAVDCFVDDAGRIHVAGIGRSAKVAWVVRSSANSGSTWITEDQVGGPASVPARSSTGITGDSAGNRYACGHYVPTAGGGARWMVRKMTAP